MFVIKTNQNELKKRVVYKIVVYKIVVYKIVYKIVVYKIGFRNEGQMSGDAKLNGSRQYSQARSPRKEVIRSCLLEFKIETRKLSCKIKIRTT